MFFFYFLFQVYTFETERVNSFRLQSLSTILLSRSARRRRYTLVVCCRPLRTRCADQKWSESAANPSLSLWSPCGWTPWPCLRGWIPRRLSLRRRHPTFPPECPDCLPGGSTAPTLLRPRRPSASSLRRHTNPTTK